MASTSERDRVVFSEWVMPRRALRDEYLLKAAQADAMFHAAIEPEEIAAWERIVVGYLELADIDTRKKFKLP